MTKTQGKLLEMLKVFHNYCIQHNLQYYLLGGTALGAARHKGFIPWDDDIDVGMPRSDYEMLKKICNAEDMGKCHFEFPGAPDFIYSYAKLYDTSTTLVENTRNRIKRGIYIDIFPLDGVGNTYEEGLKNIKPILKKNNLLSTKVCAWRKGRKLYKNLAMVLMRYIPGKSVQSLIAEIDTLCQSHKYTECSYIANCMGNWYEREIVKKIWLGKPTLRMFEDSEFYCAEMIDEYLTAIYGNWRKLPPKEKQISHHSYIKIDLNSSYLK